MDVENHTWKILVVDDEPRNLKVMQQILKDKHGLVFARDGEKALEAVEKHRPDLILLDVMMPGIDGYEVCRRLKSNPDTAGIPVIFVTAMEDVENEARGFDLGAVDYITKPVSRAVVLARVATHLVLYDNKRALEEQVAERTRELEQSRREAIFMLGEAGHYNDTDTGVHIWRMADYAGAIAREINWKVEDAALLEIAAPMHDTGKIGIPDAILKKPGKLDSDEWVVMKTHSAIGASILSKSNSPMFKMAADIAHYHHEKWDGSGYPYGLKGNDIPLSARLVAIADVFDALTMRRPYKEPWSEEDALAEIMKGSGAHFDPELTRAFRNIIPEISRIRAYWEKA
ncbi:MAG: two-component system response regulator [Deltaproteobacteria bacterium]|nr:two-component system response regulator [Deltaproteobacteria bacterium]